MAMEIMNGYHYYAAQSMAGNARKKETSQVQGTRENKETAKTQETETISKTESKSEYLRKLQKQAPYLTLEIGSGLSMKKDKRGGVLTINPLLLERMQNDPEAEKKYTQTIKDIERAEKTADAYYNALGGCVERTSHWYIDENGKYCHFAYTVRDDKLNKKLRKEAQENSQKLIEETKKKTAEKKEKLQKMLEKRASQKEAKKEEGAVPDKVKKLLDEKEAASKDGIVSLLEDEIQTIIEAAREEEAGRTDARKRQEAVGGNLDLQV